MHMKTWMIILQTLATLSVARAHDNGIHLNHCSERSIGDTRSVCQGHTLPYNRVRNKKNQWLECTGNVDNHVRYPQTETKFEDWSNALKGPDGQKEAYLMKRKQSEIAWSGQIPYESIEVWQYEECELVTSGSACGYHTDTECHMEDITENTYDDKGNVTGSRKTGERQVCEDIQNPNTCWSDITYNQSLPCSVETITFDAKYVRPTEAEWNINSPGYNDAIPNKYDLLPGEVEMVQVYSNGTQSRNIHPFVKIGDAWNEYKFNELPTFSCAQNTNYHFSAAIHTIKRDTSKSSPNAFRLPVNWDGTPIPALVWKNGMDQRKKTQVENAEVDKLQLDDVSGAMIALMAEQSRANAEREAKKDKEGISSNTQDKKDFAELSKKPEGYWKNTKIKVELVRKYGYWWNRTTHDWYTSDIDSQAPTVNYLADKEDIKFSDFWIFELASQGKLFEGGLKPNRNYSLEVSVYQRGVPFYQQSCEDAPDQSWRCKAWIRWAAYIRESEYYSKPLKIDFTTLPKEQYVGENDGNFWDNWMTGIFGDELCAENCQTPVKK